MTDYKKFANMIGTSTLTSERANLTHPGVRDLAKGINETQRKEIAEMKVLIQDIESRR